MKYRFHYDRFRMSGNVYPERDSLREVIEALTFKNNEESYHSKVNGPIIHTKITKR